MNKDQETYTVNIGGKVVQLKNIDDSTPILYVITDDIQVVEFDDVTFVIKFKKDSCSFLKMKRSNTLFGYFVFFEEGKEKFIFIGDNYYYS